MVRAEVRWIDPNDDRDWWEGRWSGSAPDCEDAYGWFALGIGDEDNPGADIFQVLVATPAAVARAQGDRKFRGVIVPLYERSAIERALQEYVSSITGRSWMDIVDKLRVRMDWEYEGM